MKSLILSMMEQYGYPGLLALIFLEHVFPPIPSEVILPFGGFLTLHTALSVPGVVLFATIGSLAGALVLYGAGFLLNRERLTRLTEGKFGKILHLNGEDLEKYFGIVPLTVIPDIDSIDEKKSRKYSKRGRK